MRLWVTQPEPGPARLGTESVVQKMLADGHECAYVSAGMSDQGAFPWSGKARIGSVPEPDAWLVSVLTHRDWWGLANLRRRLNGRVVIGGQCADLMRGWGTTFGDALVVGDIHADDRERIFDEDGEIHLRATDRPPPKITAGGRSVVFLAHGCRRRCPYCRISWAHSYTETPAEEVVRDIRATRGRRINLYSPSGDHPGMNEFYVECARRGLLPSNRDFTPRRALKLVRAGRIRGRVNIGVEGISERLRGGMRRSVAWRELAELMGKVSTHQYYLAGVPGEGAGDWGEFVEQMIPLLHQSSIRHRLTLGTFTPIPGTPWGGNNGHFPRVAGERIGGFKELLLRLNKELGEVRGLLSTARGASLHEAEVFSMRAAILEPGRMPAFLWAMTPAKAHDGRWRDAAAQAGLDVDGLLSATTDPRISIPSSRKGVAA